MERKAKKPLVGFQPAETDLLEIEAQLSAMDELVKAAEMDDRMDTIDFDAVLSDWQKIGP